MPRWLLTLAGSLNLRRRHVLEAVRILARKIVRKVLGERLFTSFRGLYWSIKLRFVRYEQETDALKALVPAGGTCLDVGANFGQFASFLARAVGPTGKVHSFEPLHYNRQIFTTVIRFMRLSNVELHPYALGPQNGTSYFTIPELNTSEAHVDSSSTGIPVQMLTLDDWAERVGLATVCFLKIDVEGFELFVLQGARRVLKVFHPVVMCEVTRDSPRRYGISPQDTFDFLKGLDYYSYIWEHQRLIRCEGPRDERINYFFVHSTASAGLLDRIGR